jgi:hypothetical protein
LKKLNVAALASQPTAGRNTTAAQRARIWEQPEKPYGFIFLERKLVVTFLGEI